MAVLVYAVLIIGGVVLYLTICWFAVVYLALPLSLLLAPILVLLGLATGLHRTTRVLTGRDTDTAVFAPAQVAAGKLPGRVRSRHVRRDRAWPQYFVMQVRMDVRAIGTAMWIVVTHAWRRSIQPLLHPDRRKVFWAWPLLLVGLAGLIEFSAGVVLMGALVAAVAATVTTVTWTIGVPVVALLRATDRAWQLVFRASASCPRCYEVTSLPMYRCPGPHSTDDRRRGDDMHRDIRPGRLGVFRRRCACGRRLPTMVLRAARSLTAYCPTCGEQMHDGAAVATDVRIPVFGASSSGKSHLIMAAMVSLVLRANDGSDGEPDGRPAGGPKDGPNHGPDHGPARASLVDDYSKRRYQEFAALAARGQSPPKTDAAQQPVAVTISLSQGSRAALLHLFDAAGEALADASINTSYGYLDYARTLIFVLDPFSVPNVRDQLDESPFADIVAEANPAQKEPESSYQSTLTRLRRYGVRTDRLRLAFAVSKRDLVERLPHLPHLAHLRPDRESVRDWLVANGLDNLVVSAERDFKEVEYFLISSKDHSDQGAVAPVRWLLEKERVQTWVQT